MNEVSIYDPRTMMGVIQRMPKVRTFLKSTFFKKVQTFDTPRIDFDVKKGSRKLAPFVHKKIGSKTVPNSGYQTMSYEPPLVAPDTVTTIDDILKRSPGENIYNAKHPKQRAIEKMGRDFQMLDEEITRREEWMIAQLLFTGTIPIVGEGINDLIDFNFTNKETLSTAEKKWTSAKADPIADMKRWRKQVQKTGLVNCNIALMDDLAVTAFLNNPNVKEKLDTRRYDLAVIKPRELPDGSTYIGTINELALDIYTYSEWFLDDWTDPEAPEDKPLVPEGTVTLLSAEANFGLYYGGVGMTDEAGKIIYIAEGTRIPDNWVERKPPRRFLSLSACPLPIPHEVDSWFTAKVV